MATWDPGLYARFGGERERPARDLLAAVTAEAPRTVVDLGCGAGGLARACAARWPAASVVGVDSSAEMLARAAGTPSPVAWSRADVAGWAPDGPVDLIVSNAALHWLGDHPRLFPRLVSHLSAGGVLAVQMPRNHDAPSHRIIREVAADGPWAAALGTAAPPAPVAPGADYFALLAPLAARIDVWETEYLHVLTEPDPVLQWIMGTTVRPLLDALAGEPALRERLLDALRERLARAYPRRPDGRTLYPFRRLFLIATR
jgi:trans-aconitate 2-methyltransferase